MEPNKTTAPAETWLDTAVKKIRFGPDRAAVRAELSAHLEDKTLDLQRIFPDMTREEAQERAVSDMGDPAEIGAELAKVHKPWLGYLWRASQVLLGVALTAAILSFQSCQSGWENLTEEPHSWYGTDWPDPVPSMYQYSDGLTYRGALADSGPIQAGEYTFTTEAGELWTVTVSGEPLRVVYFQMDVTHRRPLESLNPWAEDEFWAEDDYGNVGYNAAILTVVDGAIKCIRVLSERYHSLMLADRWRSEPLDSERYVSKPKPLSCPENMTPV